MSALSSANHAPLRFLNPAGEVKEGDKTFAYVLRQNPAQIQAESWQHPVRRLKDATRKEIPFNHFDNEPLSEKKRRDSLIRGNYPSTIEAEKNFENYRATLTAPHIVIPNAETLKRRKNRARENGKTSHGWKVDWTRRADGTIVGQADKIYPSKFKQTFKTSKGEVEHDVSMTRVFMLNRQDQKSAAENLASNAHLPKKLLQVQVEDPETGKDSLAAELGQIVVEGDAYHIHLAREILTVPAKATEASERRDTYFHAHGLAVPDSMNAGAAINIGFMAPEGQNSLLSLSGNGLPQYNTFETLRLHKDGSAEKIKDKSRILNERPKLKNIPELILDRMATTPINAASPYKAYVAVIGNNKLMSAINAVSHDVNQVLIKKDKLVPMTLAFSDLRGAGAFGWTRCFVSASCRGNGKQSAGYGIAENYDE